MQFFEKFPTIIAMDKYDGDLDTSKFLTLSRKKGTSRNVSINTHILEEDFLSDLKEFILNSLKEYFESVMPEEKVTPYITQSWVNFSDYDQYTHPHRHPNSIVSGVFYVSAEDCIEFFDGGINFNIKETKTTFYVNTNDLILFPSTLMHFVPANKSSQMRTSIAFNTFASGQFGKDDKLTGLKL